jgi:hypothetical protein
MLKPKKCKDCGEITSAYKCSNSTNHTLLNTKMYFCYECKGDMDCDTCHKNKDHKVKKYKIPKYLITSSDKLKKAEIILEETQKSTKKNNREIVNHDTNKDMEKYDIKGQIKENWFEQFNWFITSDNLLVISGKTADHTTGGCDSFTTALLQLNGHDRFSVRGADYFRKVQNYEHHTHVPRVGKDIENNEEVSSTMVIVGGNSYAVNMHIEEFDKKMDRIERGLKFYENKKQVNHDTAK